MHFSGRFDLFGLTVFNALLVGSPNKVQKSQFLHSEETPISAATFLVVTTSSHLPKSVPTQPRPGMKNLSTSEDQGSCTMCLCTSLVVSNLHFEYATTQTPLRVKSHNSLVLPSHHVMHSLPKNAWLPVPAAAPCCAAAGYSAPRCAPPAADAHPAAACSSAGHVPLQAVRALQHEVRAAEATQNTFHNKRRGRAKTRDPPLHETP